MKVATGYEGQCFINTLCECGHPTTSHIYAEWDGKRWESCLGDNPQLFSEKVIYEKDLNKCPCKKYVEAKKEEPAPVKETCVCGHGIDKHKFVCPQSPGVCTAEHIEDDGKSRFPCQCFSYTPVNKETVCQEPAPVNKETVCQEAERIVGGDRRKEYGPVSESLEANAEVWTVVLRKILKEDCEVLPEHVALCMIGTKLVRESNQHKRDNLTDFAGYSRVLELYYEEKSK